ncbi:hypothetical protein N7449_005441 [Penicillium cf. viridicatum]|uniref:Uncharacterized protein n=1 Tax=Penicillium cf. viridicatum TaxID=2972119 RepID=A0A9W9MLH3_9EURO|nr:hypothetical protein N7449_005441 [Penicillium cf. viridicatum]
MSQDGEGHSACWKVHPLKGADSPWKVGLPPAFQLRSTKPAVVPAVKPPPPSPLAVLPTSVLLRSLIVATVSSKHYILLPALLVLNFLCKPRKSRLFNVDRNPILHTILKSTIYKQ